MVSIREQGCGLFDEMLLQIRHLATYSHSTERSLSPDIWVRGGDQVLNLWEQIPRHFVRRDISESAEGESDNILVRVAQVAKVIVRIRLLL